MIQEPIYSRTAVRRNVAVVGGLVVIGLIVWYCLDHHEDARVVSAPAAAPGGAVAAKPLRIMDVLAGIPDASKSQRSDDSDGRVMWTSAFHLAGGEPGSIKMKIDPADLSYASITLTARHNDNTSSARAAAMARHFLQNVAPEFNG